MFYKILKINLLSLFLGLSVTNVNAQLDEKRKIDQPANTKKEFEESYAWRIQQTHLAGVYIPRDLFEAFRELDKKTDESSKQKFRTMTEAETEHKLFFSLGRWIWTNWSFYEGSRFSQWFRDAGITYPEDMAKIVILAYHRKLHGKDIDFKGLATRFKEKRQTEHEAWLKKNGIDPTQVKPKTKQ